MRKEGVSPKCTAWTWAVLATEQQVLPRCLPDVRGCLEAFCSSCFLASLNSICWMIRKWIYYNEVKIHLLEGSSPLKTNIVSPGIQTIILQTFKGADVRAWSGGSFAPARIAVHLSSTAPPLVCPPATDFSCLLTNASPVCQLSCRATVLFKVLHCKSKNVFLFFFYI